MTISPSRPRPAIDPRLRARRIAVSRQRGRHRLRYVLAGTVLAALCALALVVLHSSLFSARHLKVRGAVHTPPATVLAASGLAGHPPLVDVNPGLDSRRLEKLPWIAKATVEKRWPDSVTVIVTERVPVANLPADGGGVAVVDGSGRVLEHESQAPAGTVGLVVPARAGPPGSVLPTGAARALDVARILPGSLLSRILTVSAQPGGGVNLGLVGGPQVVLGSPAQLDEKFEALESLLATNVLRGPASVDLTVPDQPVVTPGSPG